MRALIHRNVLSFAGNIAAMLRRWRIKTNGAVLLQAKVWTVSRWFNHSDRRTPETNEMERTKSIIGAGFASVNVYIM